MIITTPAVMIEISIGPSCMMPRTIAGNDVDNSDQRDVDSGLVVE
jgi:hypothetical protein